MEKIRMTHHDLMRAIKKVRRKPTRSKVDAQTAKKEG
jgi:hypothetical protein